MNHMNLGDCYVGAAISNSLVLSYPIKTDTINFTTSETNELPSYAFVWPQNHPHLEFEPATGELHPDSSLTVFVKFHSDRPIVYRLAPVRCELIQTSKTAPQKVSQKDSLHHSNGGLSRVTQDLEHILGFKLYSFMQ